MVIYNAATRELTAKIVYYGPGLGGKTTNLQLLHERLEPATVGKLLNLATQTDRTIYFDLLPVELGDIKGYKIRFQLATVPGQTAFNETRRVVLKGTDGIVFVADSQWTMLPKNLESWQNLKENLKANGVSFEGIPVVIQYNKRDLTDVLSVDALQEALGLSSYPFVEAVASAGRGVTETFKLISKLTFVDLLRRLQGRKPEEAGPPPPRRETDDLLSWKDSLLNHRTGTPAPPVPTTASPEPVEKKRAFALVPALPVVPDEPPFEAGDESPTPFAAAPEAGAPFPEAGTDRSAEELYLPEMPEMPGLSEITQETAPMAAAVPAEPSPAAAIPSTGWSANAEAPSAPMTAPDAPLASPPPAPPAAPAAPAESDARMAAMETRIEEVLSLSTREREERLRAAEEARALAARLDGFERDARSFAMSLGERLEILSRDSAASDVAQRVSEMQDRLAAGDKRQRTSEDDLSMALRSFGERVEKLHQQVQAIAAQVETLESSLREKTSQSRREADDIRSEIQSLQTVIDDKFGQSGREAEDIRTQISPLLEAHGDRGASDQRLNQEFERLRESLADSLGDLSDRLRRAVRGA
ncbi:MAG: ADP-ribosylation factor-like protein [Acidobacteriota bacterium]